MTATGTLYDRDAGKQRRSPHVSLGIAYGVNLVGYSYAYDPAGNPTSRSQNGQVHTYTANTLNQIFPTSIPSQTDVSGHYQGDAVAVQVNGLPGTLQPSVKAFHKDQFPIAPGTNLFQVLVSDALAAC